MFIRNIDVFRYRVVLFGDAGTGKTALVSQFMTSEYMHTYDASLGKFSNNEKWFFVLYCFLISPSPVTRKIELFFCLNKNIVKRKFGKCQESRDCVCSSHSILNFFFFSKTSTHFVCPMQVNSRYTILFCFSLQFAADFVITNWYLTVWPFLW